MNYRRLLRFSQAALVCVLALVAMGASTASSRFDKDSQQIMCTCGCSELLGECRKSNMECANSSAMATELMASIDKGESDDTIFHQFSRQYGPVVLAAPMFTRFNHVAWVVPPLVLFLGIVGTLVLVRKWKFQSYPVKAEPRTSSEEKLRERIRQETDL